MIVSKLKDAKAREAALKRLAPMNARAETMGLHPTQLGSREVL